MNKIINYLKGTIYNIYDKIINYLKGTIYNIYDKIIDIVVEISTLNISCYRSFIKDNKHKVVIVHINLSSSIISKIIKNIKT
jgi:hypothetical protein